MKKYISAATDTNFKELPATFEDMLESIGFKYISSDMYAAKNYDDLVIYDDLTGSFNIFANGYDMRDDIIDRLFEDDIDEVESYCNENGVDLSTVSNIVEVLG